MNLLKSCLLSTVFLTVAYARGIELRNEDCRLTFSDLTGGCQGFEMGKNRFVLADGLDPELFEIVFQKEKGKETIRLLSSESCERNFSVEKLPSGNSLLRMQFQNFSLPGEKAVFDVEATVELDSVQPRTIWRLSFTNRSRNCHVAATRFPILRKVAAPGKADVLMPVGNYGGKLFRNNKNDRRATYPSFTCYTQFMGFTGKNGYSLYLAAHDPDARTKTFSVSPDQDASVLSAVTEIKGDPKAGRSHFSFAVDLISGINSYFNRFLLYKQYTIIFNKSQYFYYNFFKFPEKFHE